MKPQPLLITQRRGITWLVWRGATKTLENKTLQTAFKQSEEYSPLPNSKTLIIGRADEPTILIHKRDGVHGSQVTIVLLHHLLCPDVPLSERIDTHF